MVIAERGTDSRRDRSNDPDDERDRDEDEAVRGRRFEPWLRKREKRKPSIIEQSAIQKSCESAQAPNHAQTVVAIGAITPNASCHVAGGLLSVRRGIMVKRKPSAKAVRKPWICVIA